MEKGFSSQDAYNFARMALTQKGVKIGRHGRIEYKGNVYKAQAFATNPLVQYVTGEKAKAANKAALLADPNYQMALQQLGLARDQGNATIGTQRNQALIDFGDPTFVQGDRALQAAVGANPFGTSQTLYHNNQQNLQGLLQNANITGVAAGGGLQSGQQQAQHVYAGQQANATSALQNLLNNLTQQSQQLGQNYNLGQQNALLQTQQNLQQQGLLAAHGPKLNYGTYKLWNPRPPRQPRQQRQRLQGAQPPTNF
jgi:hypothetical protein